MRPDPPPLPRARPSGPAASSPRPGACTGAPPGTATCEMPPPPTARPRRSLTDLHRVNIGPNGEGILPSTVSWFALARAERPPQGPRLGRIRPRSPLHVPRRPTFEAQGSWGENLAGCLRDLRNSGRLAKDWQDVLRVGGEIGRVAKTTSWRGAGAGAEGRGGSRGPGRQPRAGAAAEGRGGSRGPGRQPRAGAGAEGRGGSRGPGREPRAGAGAEGRGGSRGPGREEATPWPCALGRATGPAPRGRRHGPAPRRGPAREQRQSRAETPQGPRN
jgi:ribonuclease E